MGGLSRTVGATTTWERSRTIRPVWVLTSYTRMVMDIRTPAAQGRCEFGVSLVHRLRGRHGLPGTGRFGGRFPARIWSQITTVKT